ncbi:MAG: hypothetical protein AAFQ36_11575 [Pseudomonadota bacterium]
MADLFSKHASALDSPAHHAAVVTPDDGVDLPISARAIYIGSAGDITVTMTGGDTVTFKAASGWLPVRAARIHATATTAGDIIAVW